MVAPPHRGMGHCLSCLSPAQAQPHSHTHQHNHTHTHTTNHAHSDHPDCSDPHLVNRESASPRHPRHPHTPPLAHEMNDVHTQHRARRKSNTDYVQGNLQPLLLPDDPYINGNRKNNVSSFSQYSTSIQNSNIAHPTPILATESANHLRSVQVTTEKSQKSFYHKINPPKSVFNMGSSESRSSDARINSLFEHYKDPDEDAILTEGIEKLCDDLQLCPDEFRVLVLAWKLNAEQMCRFSRTEFCQGLKAMRVDSIKGIQSRLPEIVCELRKDDELFKDLYRFTFKFGLDVVSGQRILPADVAVVLWRLVFTVCEPPILNRWLDYLTRHPHIRGIPKDTWYMFLNFAEMVGTDLSSYDDTEAWPSLFDDFVEFENDQMNQNISKSDNCRISD